MIYHNTRFLRKKEKTWETRKGPRRRVGYIMKIIINTHMRQQRFSEIRRKLYGRTSALRLRFLVKKPINLLLGTAAVVKVKKTVCRSSSSKRPNTRVAVFRILLARFTPRPGKGKTSFSKPFCPPPRVIINRYTYLPPVM